MPKAKVRNGEESPENEQLFRYWVEVLELKSQSVRSLSVTAVARIPIPRTKGDPQRPREDVLQLKDGTATLEAKSFEDLVALLRARYPDDAYERRLHWERDHEAESRRAEAVKGLIEIFLPRVYLEALYVIQAELEREGSDSGLSGTELKRAAATRGIALIDSGEWKQRDTWVHFPSSWIRQILERFACGETSLLDERAAPVVPRRPKEKSSGQIGGSLDR